MLSPGHMAALIQSSGSRGLELLFVNWDWPQVLWGIALGLPLGVLLDRAVSSVIHRDHP